MAEVEKVQPDGLATPDTPAQPTEEPKQQAPAPVLFGGKTPEQFAEEFENTRKELTALKEESSRIAHESQYWRTVAEKNQGKQEEAAPSLPSLTDEQVFANPARSMLEVAQRATEIATQKMRAEWETQRQKERSEQIANSFQRASQVAFKTTPKLYQGIEDQVRQEVWNAAASGKIGLGEVDNPDFYKMTASMIRYQRGEYDLGKYLSNTPAPAMPGGVEAPGPGMPPQSVDAMSDYEKALAKRFGITEEQYKAQWKRDREEQARKTQEGRIA